MIIIACVDERNGMMFNRRRQSRDSAVCGDILRECGGKKLYMSTYSGKLFGDVEEKNIRITEEFLKEAEEEDFCFIEDIQISGFENKIRTVILYQWNRRYPADRYFLLDLSDGSWELQRTEELKGSSHEKITKGVYERVR
ncbi:ribonuclease Z [Lachnospiraceae bacterium]|jgi:hypothetical protein|nr:hypothetical protein [uncultured Schaedlerella sp.]EOS39432.1 hypothetical protein C808_01855 [Lachnospiraceae bacterium M18-1]MCI9154161.1 ribonuclease Z [Ruminococcus sp.]NBI57638.1 ribonuclease Z [Lachnospiraceae bacterium]